jgi:hypothetical protein
MSRAAGQSSQKPRLLKQEIEPIILWIRGALDSPSIIMFTFCNFILEADPGSGERGGVARHALQYFFML